METHWSTSYPFKLHFPWEYTTCTSPKMHLICLPKFCITFVFHFSWVLQLSQEKLKTMLMQNFGGANKVHYGRCASGVCMKIKVNFGCPVVACPGATATEILLITYVRTVRQPQPFDSRLRARFSRGPSSNFSRRLRTHENWCFWNCILFWRNSRSSTRNQWTALLQKPLSRAVYGPIFTNPDASLFPSVVQIIRKNQINLGGCKNFNQSATKGQILTLLLAWASSPHRFRRCGLVRLFSLTGRICSR